MEQTRATSSYSSGALSLSVDYPSLSVDSESFESQSQSKPKSRKILIAGDSLLHRIKPNKLKVGDIPSVKLTKKGDTLSGTTGRCRNFLSKHADERNIDKLYIMPMT